MGCASDLDLEARMSQVEARVKENGKKIQNEPQVAEFNLLKSDEIVTYYNPSGRRDPFKEYEGKAVAKLEVDLTSILESFELADLQLTAIIWGIAKPKALFRAPDGYSYIGEKGTRIGRNGGKISKVSRSKLLVQEEYRSPTGDITVRQLEINLHDDEELQDRELESLDFKFSDE
ncbi:MAG: pilus assembly protein PilP [Bdellovibrionota bacterium]